MPIIYTTDVTPTAEQVIELYENCGLSRPTNDADRIGQMIANADLVVTAWDKELLVGVSRCITDWVWCCYLADLAVNANFKKAGIGRKLIDLTAETVGLKSMVLLLSVPTAMDYYPKVGFTRLDNAFIINRKK